MASSQAERRLPKVVDMIGDRIGLNYNINRRETTEAFVVKHGRLDLNNLRYSSYSLTEDKTKKSKDEPKTVNKLHVKNPLKLNAKLRKRLYKLSPLDKQKLEYKKMAEIHELWLGYSKKVVASNGGDPSNIYKLDLHGCLLKCTASKNPTLVGSEGIVVQETKNTFLIIGKTNRLVTLPKRESIFEFKLDQQCYRIHGCNLLCTIQARSKSKYKQQRSTSSV